jgi:hypothetical protein
VDDAYRVIQQRVSATSAEAPSALRQALTELFINHPAVTPHDQCTPATAKMIRYKLANGTSLGHQIETAPQHLWLAADRLPAEFQSSAKLYPAAEGGKGRHSNVNQMPDLRDRAVARVTISEASEAERLLNALLAR